MPPQFYTLLPPPGSHEAAEFAACKADIAARVRSRERSGFLDYLNDTPAARNPENFMDPEHYRADIAREIEADIAGVIAGESPRPARLWRVRNCAANDVYPWHSQRTPRRVGMFVSRL